MKYSVNQTFTNVKGEKFKDGPAPDSPDATFQTVAAQALLADVDGNNQPIRGAEKLKRFDLWIKIKSATDEVELSSEEVTLLGSAAEIFSTILYGQFKYFLEQKA